MDPPYSGLKGAYKNNGNNTYQGNRKRECGSGNKNGEMEGKHEMKKNFL